LTGCHRMTAMKIPIIVQGSQTHMISEINTVAPRGDKNLWIESGETSMTRIGAKKRSAENGQRKAIPRPPFVMASNSPWEAAAENKNQKAIANL